MISVAPDIIRFQIPFEAPAGRTRITVTSLSPFSQAEFDTPVLEIEPRHIWFLDLGPRGVSGIKAIHQDFRSLVTLDHPAQPGEIVHFYAIGLGPVSRPVRTGQPAPSDPPATLLDPLTCSIWDQTGKVPIPVHFAGLAPGMSGIYQVSVGLPATFKFAAGLRYAGIGCGPEGAGVLVIVP